jgi:LPS sulfotransferase NodH
MNFGNVVENLKLGNLAQREGWNGKDMYLFLIKGEAVRQAISDRYGDEGDGFPVCDAIYMKTADNKLVPWLASQADILSEDWILSGIVSN